jgi:hypothetical protein
MLSFRQTTYLLRFMLALFKPKHFTLFHDCETYACQSAILLYFCLAKNFVPDTGIKSGVGICCVLGNLLDL